MSEAFLREVWETDNNYDETYSKFKFIVKLLSDGN